MPRVFFNDGALCRSFSKEAELMKFEIVVDMGKVSLPFD